MSERPSKAAGIDWFPVVFSDDGRWCHIVGTASSVRTNQEPDLEVIAMTYPYFVLKRPGKSVALYTSTYYHPATYECWMRDEAGSGKARRVIEFPVRPPKARER